MMAYFNLLAAVPESEVERIRSDLEFVLRPSLVLGASHLLAYWVQEQPLGRLLGEAIDGGEVLHHRLWHPLRVPVFHRPAKVHQLAEQITAAWVPIAEIAKEDDGWLSAETTRLLRLYCHAAEARESVVSVIQAPADAERAVRVRIPWRRKYGA